MKASPAARRARAAHRFLARQSLYPLACASALALGLLAGRAYLSQSRHYSFLVWNLLLAWVPYLISLGMAAAWHLRPRAGWRLALPGALWLIFLPNAPYLVTDFVHLRSLKPIPLWYDIGMLASFAWAGAFWRSSRSTASRRRSRPPPGARSAGCLRPA